MSESKDLALKEQTDMVVPKENIAQSLADFGIVGDVVFIPKLLLMHGSSKLVGEGKYKLGDLIDSNTGEIVAAIDKPLEIIPLKMSRCWRISDMSKKPAKFIRIDPCTNKNEKQAWEAIENGIPVKRELCYDFFVLVRSKLETSFMPYSIRFKGKSVTQGGKLLSTQMFNRICCGKVPYSESAKITIVRELKDTNYYAVLTYSKGTDLSPEEFQLANECFKKINTSKVEVTGEDEEVSETHAEKSSEAPSVPTNKTVVDDDMPF